MSTKQVKRKKLLMYMPVLIEEVKKREWLWNPTHQLYTRRDMVSRSWDDISKKVKLPVTVCKKKWKNLKDVFRRELMKCGSVEDYDGAWQFFERLSFLSVFQPCTDQVKCCSHQNNGNNKKFETQFVKLENVESTFSEGSNEVDSNEYPVKIELAEDEDPLPPVQYNHLTEEDDCDLMFFKSLVPYMGQLDPFRKLVVRNKIQNVLICELEAQINLK